MSLPVRIDCSLSADEVAGCLSACGMESSLLQQRAVLLAPHPSPGAVLGTAIHPGLLAGPAQVVFLRVLL